MDSAAAAAAARCRGLIPFEPAGGLSSSSDLRAADARLDPDGDSRSSVTPSNLSCCRSVSRACIIRSLSRNVRFELQLPSTRSCHITESIPFLRGCYACTCTRNHVHAQHPHLCVGAPLLYSSSICPYRSSRLPVWLFDSPFIHDCKHVHIKRAGRQRVRPPPTRQRPPRQPSHRPLPLPPSPTPRDRAVQER